MNFKTTILLLVLLAGVGIYFGVEHWTGANKTTGPSTDTSKLVSAASDTISKITITQSDGSKIVLDRSGTQWRLAQPISAPADKTAVDELLRQITSLQSRGQLPAEGKSSVGLDKPRSVIEVTSGGKVTRLSFGDENKIGDSLYVLVDNQSTPQIVDTAISKQLDQQADAYRSKKLIDLPFGQTDQIKQLAITQDEKTIRLEKQEEGWEIIEPRRMPADASAISSLLSSVADLSATEFVQNPSSSAGYGLTKPKAVVWYSMAAPTTGPATAPATRPAGTTIDFGRFESLDKQSLYARVNDGPIALVAATSKEAFDKTALDLRDKKVIDLDPAHVERFTLSVDRAATTQPTTQPAEQHEYTIARRKENKIIGPMPEPAPATRAAGSEPSTHPGLASTEPATGPAATEPTTRPTLASTEPATKPAAATSPASKWVFESGGRGDANDSQVEALLGALHPLQATKFLETAPTTRPSGSYTLTVHVGPAAGKGPQDYVLHFANPGATGDVVGVYDDLTFETDRAIVDKLDAKFK
jgi:hypothetical protein